jgi:3-hydroxy-5-methyl-1-naphthoate 3-O-methyltransferase
MIGLSTKSLKPPSVIHELMSGQWAGAIVSTSATLKLFDAVDLGFRSAEEVARECSIKPRAAELLLNALVALELLTKDEKGFSTTEESHYYLVSTSPLYAGQYFELRPALQDAWSNLETVAKTGKPFSEWNKEETAQKFFPALAAALFSFNYAYGQRLCAFLKIEERTGKTRVLDLACGSAVWSIPMARANKNVHVDALDFPVVLDTTRKFTEKSGVKEQYSYISGNWQDIALADDEYDIVILGHILHSEGKKRSRELLSYAHKSLKKGGSVVVGEFLVDDTRTSPVFSAMFAINMYLVTTDGCVYSRSELREMLTESGFSNARDLPRGEKDSDVVIADKT